MILALTTEARDSKSTMRLRVGPDWVGCGIVRGAGCGVGGVTGGGVVMVVGFYGGVRVVEVTVGGVVLELFELKLNYLNLN